MQEIVGEGGCITIGLKMLLQSCLISRNKLRSSSRGSTWPRGRPRGQILKFLVLALASKVKSLFSKPQIFKNCPVLSSRTALFFVPLKYCRKTPETSRKKLPGRFFCFPQLDIAAKKIFEHLFFVGIA